MKKLFDAHRSSEATEQVASENLLQLGVNYRKEEKQWFSIINAFGLDMFV